MCERLTGGLGGSQIFQFMYCYQIKIDGKFSNVTENETICITGCEYTKEGLKRFCHSSFADFSSIKKFYLGFDNGIIIIL